MKGFVPTPPSVVDHMVAKLFKKNLQNRKIMFWIPAAGEERLSMG
jgi:hypothetical protein